MADQEQLKQAQNIDSVTDYVEDKDDANLQSGLSSLAAKTAVTSTPDIKISRDDILLIANELEVSKDEAEKMLRKFSGDVKSALSSFISGV
mmetsp:Transcript_25102/g.37007  ORF Transcript_25102/g.37007 Transcript_25102/m.37007 type:complete len:91 (+) Transcript_25102:47-319(+)